MEKKSLSPSHQLGTCSFLVYYHCTTSSCASFSSFSPSFHNPCLGLSFMSMFSFDCVLAPSLNSPLLQTADAK